MADVAAAERPAVNYGDLYASSSVPAADEELEEMREKHKHRSVAVVAVIASETPSQHLPC